MSGTWDGAGRARPQNESAGRVAGSIAAGIAAGLVGAIIWAVIAKVTDHEIGYVALGIGFLVGTAMVAAGGVSQLMPVAGAAIALVSCLIGKFFAIVYVVSAEWEVSIGEALNRFSANKDLTWELYKSTFGGMDVLFLAFAGYMAFQLTRTALAKAQAAAGSTGDTSQQQPYSQQPYSQQPYSQQPGGQPAAPLYGNAPQPTGFDAPPPPPAPTYGARPQEYVQPEPYYPDTAPSAAPGSAQDGPSHRA